MHLCKQFSCILHYFLLQSSWAGVFAYQIISPLKACLENHISSLYSPCHEQNLRWNGHSLTESDWFLQNEYYHPIERLPPFQIYISYPSPLLIPETTDSPYPRVNRYCWNCSAMIFFTSLVPWTFYSTLMWWSARQRVGDVYLRSVKQHNRKVLPQGSGIYHHYSLGLAFWLLLRALPFGELYAAALFWWYCWSCSRQILGSKKLAYQDHFNKEFGNLP